MNSETNPKPKPKKILIKKDKERKFFESLDINYPLSKENKKTELELLLKKDDSNNNTSGEKN